MRHVIVSRVMLSHMVWHVSQARESSNVITHVLSITMRRHSCLTSRSNTHACSRPCITIKTPGAHNLSRPLAHTIDSRRTDKVYQRCRKTVRSITATAAATALATSRRAAGRRSLGLLRQPPPYFSPATCLVGGYPAETHA